MIPATLAHEQARMPHRIQRVLIRARDLRGDTELDIVDFAVAHDALARGDRQYGVTRRWPGLADRLRGAMIRSGVLRVNRDGNSWLVAAGDVAP